MDNDNILKKKLVHVYRKLRLNIDYVGMNLLTEKDGNKKIANLLKSDEPFAVGRFGAVEMHCVSKWMRGKYYSKNEAEQALYAAGIFPNDKQTIDCFSKIYTEAISFCDVLGVWEVIDEKKAIKKYTEVISIIPSKSIEPYYFSNPWSQELTGKQILVIHPFIDSIEKQFKNRRKLWNNENILPEFKSLITIKAIQSNAGSKTQFVNWIEALDYMKSEINKVNFDVAIIGAGAYGLPLAAYVKSLGKQAIQMAGATQILFGIKGKRWDKHPIISEFYNDYWVRPDLLETPPQAKRVEGGSYW